MKSTTRDGANAVLQFGCAGALILLVFYCVWNVANGTLKADSAVVGSAFTLFVVFVNFCFPNSIGAQKQQDTINTLANANAAPLTTTQTTTTERTPYDGPQSTGADALTTGGVAGDSGRGTSDGGGVVQPAGDTNAGTRPSVADAPWANPDSVGSTR